MGGDPSAPERDGNIMSGFNLKREPTSPGEILRAEFLEPLHITQGELARHIGCDVKVINRIVNGSTGVTAEMAIRLGAALRTSPDLWLNAQQAVNLYRASKDVDPPTVLPKLKVAMA